MRLPSNYDVAAAMKIVFTREEAWKRSWEAR